MSVSIQEALQGKQDEVRALKKVAEAYPDAALVSGRLYEVGQFRPATSPTTS